MPVTAAQARESAIDRLAHGTFDLLVVGGGITGTGVALEAASRGLRVALVERDDLAVGTSSRSSKLIHGGLRYLEQYRFGLVREALAERAILRRIAPHLVRLEPFLIPVYGVPLKVPYYGVGLALYGLLGAARGVGFPRFLSPSAARLQHPSLRARGFRGAWVYHDGIEDDARFVVAVARTAIAAGATLVTRMRATELCRSSAGIDGAILEDTQTGNLLRVRAAAVLDATGITGGDGGPFGISGHGSTMPSRGIHLVVRRARIPGTGGLTIRVPGRVVFLIPWNSRWIIGTTDHAHEGPTDRPAATCQEMEELLAAVNGVLDVGLSRADVVATFAGIRPLVGGGRSTVTASREHEIREPTPRLFMVRGGKYTTYRLMAEQIVDRIVDRDRASVHRSVTATRPLVGAPAATFGGPAVASQETGKLARTFGLDPRVVEHLIGRHGLEVAAVLTLGRERNLLRLLHPELPYLEAEVAWAVEQELALSLDDILARRMRLAFEVPDHGASVAARTAEIAGPLLGWTEAEVVTQVASYAETSAREYGIPS